MADVLSNYRPGAAYDEMIDAEGCGPPVLPGHPQVAEPLQPDRAAPHRRLAGQQLHPGRGDVRRRRGGAAVPARPGAAGDRRRRVGHHRGRRRPAGQGPGGLPGRRVRRGPGDRRRRRPQPADHLLHPLPPRGLGHRAGQRRTRPRGRGGPDPQPRRRRTGARGQRPGAQRGLLRDDQPQRHDHRAARRLRQPADPAGRGSTRPGCSPRCASAPRPASTTRRWSCSPPGSTTPPTSSTPCWPAPWASSWSRAATWSAAAARSTCGPPPGRSGWT